MAGLKPPPISLSPTHVRQMIDHAAESSPWECCGLLVGVGRKVERIIRIKNISMDPNSFTMDPKELVEAFHIHEELGLQVVGMYHSHPHSPPFPSDSDLSQSNYPEIPQIIVGKNGNDWEVRFFKIWDSGYAETDLF